MQIKNLLVAVLAATVVATTNDGQHKAVRRDVTAEAVQEATVDLAGTAFLNPDDVIKGLEKLTDIADSMIDIAGDFIDLNVAKVVPDVAKLAQGFAQEVSVIASFFGIGGSGGSTSGGLGGIFGGIGGIFGGGKKPSDNNDDSEQEPFAMEKQLEICKLFHKLVETEEKFFDLFIGKAGVLSKIPVVGQLIIPALKKFEDSINGVAKKIIKLVPECAEQAKKDLEALQGKLTDAESAYTFTYQYTYSTLQPKRTAVPEA